MSAKAGASARSFVGAREERARGAVRLNAKSINAHTDSQPSAPRLTGWVGQATTPGRLGCLATYKSSMFSNRQHGGCKVSFSPAPFSLPPPPLLLGAVVHLSDVGGLAAIGRVGKQSSKPILYATTAPGCR